MLGWRLRGVERGLIGMMDWRVRRGNRRLTCEELKCRIARNTATRRKRRGSGQIPLQRESTAEKRR